MIISWARKLTPREVKQIPQGLLASSWPSPRSSDTTTIPSHIIPVPEFSVFLTAILTTRYDWFCPTEVQTGWRWEGVLE